MFEGIATVKINNLVNVSSLSSTDINRLNNAPEKEFKISIDDSNNLKKYCEFSKRHYYYKYDSSQDIWVSDFEILKLISKKQNNKQEIKEVVQNIPIEIKSDLTKNDKTIDVKTFKPNSDNVISSPDLDNLLQSLNKPKISNSLGNDLLNSLKMDINRVENKFSNINTNQSNNTNQIQPQNIQFQNIPNQPNNVVGKKLSEMNKKERKKLLNKACNKCHKIHRAPNSKCT